MKTYTLYRPSNETKYFIFFYQKQVDVTVNAGNIEKNARDIADHLANHTGIQTGMFFLLLKYLINHLQPVQVLEVSGFHFSMSPKTIQKESEKKTKVLELSKYYPRIFF